MKHIRIVAAASACLLVTSLSALGQGRGGSFAAPDDSPGSNVRRIADDVDLGPAGSELLSRRALAAQRFQAANAGTALFEQADRVRRVYGKAFAHAETPQASAELFLQDHAAMFGVDAENLHPAGPFPDGRHVQPIMYDPETDSYKFTGVYYSQYQDDIPVFRSRLMLLVRNEPTNPLVLASSDLRDLGGFRVAAPALDHVDIEAGRQRILDNLGIDGAMAEQVDFDDAELVIWAGVDDDVAPPRLAFEQTVQVGVPTDPDTYQKWLILVDAFTGEELFRENEIVKADVTGNVSCRCTAGLGASICHGTEVRPLPYARVNVGGNVTYADAEGNYTLTGVNPGPATVFSEIRGLYFELASASGKPVLVLSQSISAPGTADFLHNNADAEEFTRAAGDAYFYANEVRDFVLSVNPSYPTVSTQTGFQINVNLTNNCNAFYDGTSINFFTSGDGCANTAFSSVVHHEYGHHLVATGGSGQGAYGEGMSDTVSILITKDPILAYGFNSDCNDGIRSADNTLQYPCSGGIHFCGQLLSGSVWDTMQELMQTNPGNYSDIISSLTINSILLHTGSSIDPSITIDFLTLDDDDDDIFNGTPHYAEIDTGFGAHNMDPGPSFLHFDYPQGLPEIIAPNGTATFEVSITPLAGEPVPGTATLHYRLGTSGPFTETPLDPIGPDTYEVELPGADCGTPVMFYLSAESTSGGVQTSPREAPDVTFTAFSAADISVAFADDFDDDLGWIAGAAGDTATSGHWVRDDPVGTSTDQGQAQPSDPFVGSACYITGQHPGGGAGANDVDNGTTTLFSPVLDLADAHDAVISYQRWYSNHAGASPFNDIFVVDVSNDGGQSWVNVETVGPGGSQVVGGWNFHQFLVSDFVAPTDEVQVRFIASDFDPQALIEAAVDQFRVSVIDCDSNTCPGDLSGDDVVDGADLLVMLSNWGPCAGCEADLNGDDAVDGSDLLQLLSEWGECP